MSKRFLFGIMLFFSFAVQAQVLDDDRALFDKVERLERDVILMQRRLYKNAPSPEETGEDASAPKGNVEHLYAKMAENEKIAQESTAQVEELNFKINQLTEKLDVLSKDMNIRFEQLEKQMQEMKTAAPEEKPVKVEEKPKQEKPLLSAQDAYQKAYQFLKQGDYPEAESALKQFLEDYPEDTLAGNAQYWLGETYYVQGMYDQAAVCFAAGFKKYKDSPKGADSLLKLGMTMERLDKKKEACTAFKNMEKSFPKASDSLKSKAKAEIKKLSCSESGK